MNEVSIWGSGGKGVAKWVVLECQKSKFIGWQKVGGRELSKTVGFEEAVDASHAIRRGLP